MSSFQDFGVFVHNNPESPEAILCYTPFRFLRVLLIKDQKKNNKKTMPNSLPYNALLSPPIYLLLFFHQFGQWWESDFCSPSSQTSHYGKVTIGCLTKL